MDFEIYNWDVEEQKGHENDLTDTDYISLYYKIRDDEKNPIRQFFYEIVNERRSRDVVEASAQTYRILSGKIPTSDKNAATRFANVLRPIFAESVSRGNTTFAQIAELAIETPNPKRKLTA